MSVIFDNLLASSIVLETALFTAAYVVARELWRNPHAERGLIRYRVFLLTMFSISGVANIPSIYYQYIKSTGIEDETLRLFSASTAVPRNYTLAITIFLVIFYKIKFRE